MNQLFLCQLNPGELFTVSGDSDGFFGVCKLIRLTQNGPLVEVGGALRARIERRGGIKSYQRWENQIVARA